MIGVKKTNLLLLILGFLLAIASVEVLLRLINRYNPPKYPPSCFRAQPICDLFELYEPYGFRLKPSRNEEYYYPYFDENRRLLSMISDENGFRNSHGFGDQGESLEIVVLGDSQVFGEGVEEEERFTNLIEAYHPEWHIDNLAMPGYGTDLMLMTLENVGIDLNPDVVIFIIFADDLSRVYPYFSAHGVKIPHFALRSGKLVKTPYPGLEFWDQLHVTWLARNVYWKISQSERKLNKAILDRFLALADQNSFTPVIVFLPYNFETQEKRLRADEDRMWLGNYAEQNAVPFFDLTDSLRDVGWRSILIENNPHFNPAGHEIIAKELNTFLEEQVINNEE